MVVPQIKFTLTFFVYFPRCSLFEGLVRYIHVQMTKINKIEEIINLDKPSKIMQI